MDITEVMRRAWRVFWTRRELWVLGILAALFGQGELGINTNYNQSLNSRNTSDNPTGLPPWVTENLAAWAANPIPLIAALIGIFAVIGIVFLVIGAWMESGLIHGTAVALNDQPISIRASLDYGRSRFGAMVLLKLLMQIPVYIIVILAIILFVPTWLTLMSSIGNPDPNPSTFAPFFASFLCLIPLFLLLIPYGIVIGLIDDLAFRYCVLEGSGPWQSLRQGWKLFTANLGMTIVFALLLWVITFLLGLVVAVPQFALLFITIGQISSGNVTPLATGTIVAMVIYGITTSVGLGGILTSFTATLWTLLFRRFQESAALPSSSSAASSLGG